MTETMATLDGILKDFYIGPVRRIFNAEVPLYNRVQRDRENIKGRQAIFPVHLAWSERVGSIGETEDVPGGANEVVVQAIVPIRTLAAHFEISSKIIEASSSDAGAFTQALRFKMQELTDNMKKELETQLQGDGSGALARITAVDASNDRITVDNPGVLRPQMRLKAASARTGGTTRTAPASAVVQSVDYITGRVQFPSGTLSGTNWAVNDFVFRGDDTRFYGRGENLMGLLGIVDDGTYVSTLHGISRTTYDLWKGTVLHNGGVARDLTLSLLQAAEDNVYVRTGARPTALYSHLAQRQRYVELLIADRRFVNVMKFDGGVRFDALEYNERPWFVSRECPKDVVYLLDEDSLRFFMLKDISWFDRAGVLTRNPSKLTYVATLEMHAEFGSYMPSRNAVIRDLTVPTSY